jgi:hypothetical protein
MPALRADTILFNDLSDALTVTTSNPARMSAYPCVTDPTNAETCSVLVEAPSATATITDITPSTLFNGVPFIFIQEPGIDSSGVFT